MQALIIFFLNLSCISSLNHSLKTNFNSKLSFKSEKTIFLHFFFKFSIILFPLKTLHLVRLNVQSVLEPFLSHPL